MRVFAPVRATTIVLGLVLGLCAGVRAQDDEPPAWKLDPYTRNDPDAWAAAGYAPATRFGFGDDHGTRDVEELLGGVHLIWVETAHFRLGSTLPEVKLENSERKTVRAELERLAERLPKVKPSTRSLDPWLRLHLYAMRLEDTYAAFQERLGVTDADFPAAGWSPPVAVEGEPAPELGEWRGEGPYLGLREKFPVLLLEKKSSLGRYCNRWGTPVAAPAPQRFSFQRRGCLGFATAWEFFEGKWKLDAALHAHVVWNLIQNLATGYKGYRHVLPAWFADGLASWYQRQVDPRYPTFSGLAAGNQLAAEEWDWPPKVRARVKHDYYPSLDAMLGWRLGDTREFADTMMCWSKVDWLMAHDDDHAMGRFVEALKAPIVAPPDRAPNEDEVEARARQALQDVWGLEPAAFDSAWSQWVLDRYPKK